MGRPDSSLRPQAFAAFISRRSAVRVNHRRRSCGFQLTDGPCGCCVFPSTSSVIPSLEIRPSCCLFYEFFRHVTNLHWRLLGPPRFGLRGLTLWAAGGLQIAWRFIAGCRVSASFWPPVVFAWVRDGRQANQAASPKDLNKIASGQEAPIKKTVVAENPGG